MIHLTMTLVVSLTRKIRRILRETRRSSSILSKYKVEVEDERREPSAVTIRVGLINPRSNIRAIRRQMEMEILGSKMGFTLLTASGFESATRVVGLLINTPLYSMIHGPTVCKIINPSPCMLPMSFKRKC